MEEARRERRWPGIDRSMAEVDAGLREKFWGLLLGELPWPLFLYGPTGTGKTLAAMCLSDYVPDSLYITADKLTDLMWKPGDPWWGRLRECALVIVDELGETTIKDTERAAYNGIKRCLDGREMHTGRVGVYITNHSPADIAVIYDDRIASRVLCGTRHHLDGNDRRLPR